MLHKLKQLDKKELWAGISVLTALFFMLFIYAPIELYCYNKDEFWFDLYKLMPVMLVVFAGSLLFSAVVFGALFVLLPRFYRIIVLPMSFVAFLCTYVQGNFLVRKLPAMDGSEPYWGEYRGEMIQSAILWLVVTVLVIILYRVLRRERFAQGVRLVSICMILMLAVTLSSVLLTTGGYKKKQDACSTVKDQYLYSEDQNFIVFILDTVDAATLSEMMEEQPEYKDIFEDFVYYENMMGGYACTEVAVPHILSGVWYENEKPMLEYAVESYNTSPFLETLSEQGYSLGMYEYDMPYEDNNIFRFDNVLENNSKISDYVAFAKLQIKLVGLRYAPYQLKYACVFNSARFGALWETNGEYPVYIAENKTFYDRLREAEITKTDDKIFKFIHIDGAHVPFWYDEDLIRIEDGTYRDSMKATLTVTREYLEKLKDAGVYDNSVIVIMADHGFAEEYGYVEDVKACEWRQNPIFFVKTANEHHQMQVSTAPVSYADLQETFKRLLAGCKNNDIFDWKEGEQRERRYIYYDFVEDEYMYEYISNGHAADDDAMVLTGNVYVREE